MIDSTVNLSAVIAFAWVLGSLLNTVIYRVPRMRTDPNNRHEGPSESTFGEDSPFNLFLPRSFCPACNTPLAARHLIPIFSYIVLKGRCGHCRELIPARYLIVEIATVVAFVLSYLLFGLTIAALCFALAICLLICLAWTDFETGLLPDELTGILVFLGCFASAYFSGGEIFVSPLDAIIGVIAGYLSLWVINHGFHWIRGKQGMGYGDFKLFAAIGAWVGWQLLPITLVIAVIFSFGFVLTRVYIRREEYHDSIEFGPSLALAATLSLFYQHTFAVKVLPVISLSTI